MSTVTFAPLAQLHDIDQSAWIYLMERGSTADPDQAVLMQACAAALLGDRELSLRILRDTHFQMGRYPDLTPPERTLRAQAGGH